MEKVSRKAKRPLVSLKAFRIMFLLFIVVKGGQAKGYDAIKTRAKWRCVIINWVSENDYGLKATAPRQL